jgi:hypothetical protein
MLNETVVQRSRATTLGFNAVRAIQHGLTNTAIEAVLDGQKDKTGAAGGFPSVGRYCANAETALLPPFEPQVRVKRSWHAPSGSTTVYHPIAKVKALFAYKGLNLLKSNADFGFLSAAKF